MIRMSWAMRGWSGQSSSPFTRTSYEPALPIGRALVDLSRARVQSELWFRHIANESDQAGGVRTEIVPKRSPNNCLAGKHHLKHLEPVARTQREVMGRRELDLRRGRISGTHPELGDLGGGEKEISGVDGLGGCSLSQLANPADVELPLLLSLQMYKRIIRIMAREASIPHRCPTAAPAYLETWAEQAYDETANRRALSTDANQGSRAGFWDIFFWRRFPQTSTALSRAGVCWFC